LRAKRYVFELGGHDHLVSKNSFADNVVVIDFETTRLSPDQGVARSNSAQYDFKTAKSWIDFNN